MRLHDAPLPSPLRTYSSLETAVPTTVRRSAPGKPVRVVGTVQDITERKVLENRLKHQASHDPLTDLPNRFMFLNRLTQALKRDERREGKVTVLYLDLDNFKLVNDSFGHTVGDRLLTRIASRLRTCVRKT